MISYNEALAIVESLRRPSTETASLVGAWGKVLAEPIVSTIPSPPFDNSAMDGFAVGSMDGPWSVVGTVQAGSTWPAALAADEAVAILTGAPIPKGTHGVLPQEDAGLSDGRLSAREPVSEGAHIRRAGEEYSVGAVLAKGGEPLTPPLIGALAATGRSSVSVLATPKVGLLVTGSELVPLGVPLGEGQIYESNSAALSAWLNMLGCTPTVERVEDDPEQTASAFRNLANSCDLILTTGGVCYGSFDFVRGVVAACGFETRFEGVAIKPGKPVTFATRGDEKAWFGLPGNPMSSLVTFALLGLPYLGRPLAKQTFALGHEVTRRAGREEFVPARLVEGRLELRLPVGSHATSALAWAQGLARIPGQSTQLFAGDTVEFYWLPWGVAR